LLKFLCFEIALKKYTKIRIYYYYYFCFEIALKKIHITIYNDHHQWDDVCELTTSSAESNCGTGEI
jgi:hypothetical protein